jgi:hypothetical protein
MVFIYTQLILVTRNSCAENGAEFTMRGIPDTEPIDKKKCITRFQVAPFRNYAKVLLLIPPIPDILTTFFIIVIKGRFVTSITSPGGNQGELPDRVSDPRPGNSGGVAPW